MKNKHVLAALQTVLGIPELDNRDEVIKALRACETNSPIALERARRALMRALKSGDLPDNLRQLCSHAIEDVTAQRGSLPEFSGKNMAIHLRVEPERKRAYVRAAHRAGTTLSDWMLTLCDRAAGVELK